MLRNRNEKNETKLKGVILATDPSKIKFGQFTQLENWIPSGIAHLKKKRGISILSSGAISPAVPSACAGIPAGTGNAGTGTTVAVTDPNA